MKIKFNNKEIDSFNFCRFTVIDNKLFNLNTKRFEAVEGDTIKFKINQKLIEDEVVDYTTYQVIPTKHHGTVILSASEVDNIVITHNTKVYGVL